MRVCWIVRPNLDEHPGGDTTQVHRTADALRALGVDVRLTSDRQADFQHADLVHLFHLDRLWEHVPVCRALRRSGRPAVLSTIYWPADEFDDAARLGWQGRLARVLGSDAYRTLRLWQRAALDGVSRRSLSVLDAKLRSFDRAARYLLDTVAAILPNSHAEAEILRRQFGRVPDVHVVPNAADGQCFGLPDTPTARAGVLAVGRLEPRKNQLALIKACRDLDAPLTLIGSAGRFSAAYAAACKQAAGTTTRFLPQQPSTVLAEHYQRAAVHACVSWYETPGLASVEAGLCGCRLVVTPGGCTREYFGDDAFYCAPDDVTSIRRAVESALSQPMNDGLAQRIRRDYTWEAAGQATLRAYEAVLSASADGSRVQSKR